MRILLKFVLDCEPDAAWRAIRSPAVFAAVASPLAHFSSLEADGFAARWAPGKHPVAMTVLGGVRVGEQVIDISYSKRGGATRTMRDSGYGVSGPLRLVTRWQHTMAISPAGGGRALYRDQLQFEAGPLTALLWPLYWAFWQWRSIRIRRLAPAWTA